MMPKREPRRDRVQRETYLLAELVTRRLVAELERVCRLEGITAAQYPVLWVLCLSDARDGVPQGAISDGLVTQASDVSRLVTRLEESKLVERRRDRDDKRVTLVRATPRGRAVFERTTAHVKALHDAQFVDLDDAELDRLRSLLNRVLWSGVAADRTDEASVPTRS